MNNKFILETENSVIQSQNLGVELWTGIANFQKNCPTIAKNKKGYGYNYADFTKAIETIKPILHEHGLGFTQLLEGTNLLRTVVFHYATGQFLQVVTQLPTGYELKGMNIYQTEGARNTYYKRYVLFGALGIVTEEEDIDAKGATKKIEPVQPQPAQPTKPTLNNNQFIQLLGAVNAGEITVKQAFESYEFNEQQKNTLNTL